MTNLPTTAEIADLIEFLRSELDERISMGIPRYMGAHRSALAIAERLPALVAERETIKVAEPSADAINAAEDALRHAIHWNAPDEMKRALVKAYAIDVAPLLADIARLTKERGDFKRSVEATCELVHRNGTEIVRLSRENATLREALGRIRDKHLGDQPASDGRSEYEWARDHFAEQRKIARAALWQLDAPQPVEMLVSQDWLRQKVESDPDIDSDIDVPLTEEAELRTPYTPRAMISNEAMTAEFVMRDEPTFHRLTSSPGIYEIVSQKDRTVIGMHVDLSTLAAARQTIAEAVDLMRPFAKIADQIDAFSARPLSETGTTVDENSHTNQWPPSLPVTCRIGECIAARAFVDAHGKKEAIDALDE